MIYLSFGVVLIVLVGERVRGVRGWCKKLGFGLEVRNRVFGRGWGKMRDKRNPVSRFWEWGKIGDSILKNLRCSLRKLKF
jgi:hypothetical protein